MPSSQNTTASVQLQDEFLKLVQLSGIFPDCKTFVDLNIKSNNIQDAYEEFQKTHKNPEKDDVKKFVCENFESTGSFENWTPKDHTYEPAFLKNVTNERYKKFATDLVAMWPQLARVVKAKVSNNQTHHTLVPLPNGFIIPGGRFKEVYYWDTLWIVQGLLLSEMPETVRGILENFLYLVEKFGFIPNGNRTYYLTRSQPPLLTLMVCEYIKYTNDVEWLKMNIAKVEKELMFWLENRNVEVELNGKKYLMMQYRSDCNTPRPESYAEDVHTASMFEKKEEQEKCYSELRSAAESGWDFSSRWIFDDSGRYQLHKIETTRVVPVELNAFLQISFKEVSRFYKLLGNQEKSTLWKTRAEDLQKAIDEVLYDEIDGIWYDFDLQTKTLRKHFVASNFAPLWTESYDKSKTADIARKVYDYLQKHDVTKYHGVPTSLVETGQQWDFPNTWPPLQDIVVMGLEKTQQPECQKLARTLADRWLESNLAGYERTNDMFEKYDSRTSGQYGGGGEYLTQTGFGWTNGVVLSFINYFYGKK